MGDEDMRIHQLVQMPQAPETQISHICRGGQPDDRPWRPLPVVTTHWACAAITTPPPVLLSLRPALLGPLDPRAHRRALLPRSLADLIASMGQ